MTKNLDFNLEKYKKWLCMAMLLTAQAGFGQAPLPLNDLSFFQNTSSSWKIVSDVKADLNKNGTLNFSEGTGILVNQPDKKNPGKDLLTKLQYGDLDLELDYMMAKNSNSGIYLQG